MNATAHSFDVSAETFQAQVIDASHEVPILVDFWATWCGPCQTLLPILMKLAQDYQGQFRLAKVEIDQQQALASHFGVRSVPTVKLIKQGRIVDEFMGALPENEIRKFLDKHIEKESDRRMQQALTLYQQGKTDTALAQMQQIILDDADNMQIRLMFAGVLLDEQRLEDARQLLASLPLDQQTGAEAMALFARLEWAETLHDAPAVDVLVQRIEADPKDSEARYKLSAHYMAQGQYAAALDQLLEIVRRDRQYNDDAGRKGVLRIFELLGNQGDIVSKYRRLLAQALN